MDQHQPPGEPTRPQGRIDCETEPCPICGHPMTAILAGLALLTLTCPYCDPEAASNRGPSTWQRVCP